MKYNSIEWLIRELDLDNDGPTMKAINKARAMHMEEIKGAYNQGYRDGEHDASNIPLSIGDISEYNNAEIYYEQTYKGNK